MDVSFSITLTEPTQKIVVLFANQKHPLHKHKIKEETFQILYGKLY